MSRMECSTMYAQLWYFFQASRYDMVLERRPRAPSRPNTTARIDESTETYRATGVPLRIKTNHSRMRAKSMRLVPALPVDANTHSFVACCPDLVTSTTRNCV